MKEHYSKILSIIGVTLAVTATLIFFSDFGREYQSLLTNVSADKMSRILQKLEIERIPFQLRDGGTTIAIPKDLLHSIRMKLLIELGHSSLNWVGLESLEKTNEENIKRYKRDSYLRNLETEMSKTIASLKSVNSAKVLLPIPHPEESVASVSAAVVVELKTGEALTTDEIFGIKNLVSLSLIERVPENVTVIDHHGKFLSR